MSETDCFVDSVFLARFGLQRWNVLDYFLLPLNPFRTKVNTSNEILMMQGTTIGTLMQFGTMGEPLGPQQAEDEYSNALKQNNGEQYELLPPHDPKFYTMPSVLYTIRHVLRTSSTNVKVLGIYYVVEGVIYKAPSVRSLMKANVTKTLEGISEACSVLSVCARFQPATGYTFHFEAGAGDGDKKRSADEDADAADEIDDLDPVALRKLHKRMKRRKILDHRRPGERTAAEEEGIRASEAMDRILVRLSQSSAVKGNNTTKSTSAAAGEK